MSEPTVLDTVNSVMKGVELVVTLIIAGLGIYFANSYRRQQKLRVEENRLRAYKTLWGKMRIASPYRLAKWVAQPLTKDEREQLFKDFSDWYYADGNGMFLGDSARAIYLKAKDNLVRDLEYYEPPEISEKLGELTPEERNRARGYLSIRQLSLLRQGMKAELRVFGVPYHVNINKLDRQFLEDCKENPDEEPWNMKDKKTDRSKQVVEIFKD